MRSGYVVWVCSLGVWSGYEVRVCGLGMRSGYAVWVCGLGMWSGYVAWVCGMGMRYGCVVWVCDLGMWYGYEGTWSYTEVHSYDNVASGTVGIRRGGGRETRRRGTVGMVCHEYTHTRTAIS